MKKAILVGTLIGLAAASAAWAQPGQGERKGPPHGVRGEQVQEAVMERLVNDPKMAEEVGLGEDQITALKTGAYDLKKQKIQKRAEMELAALEQARLITGETVNREAIMKAVEETGRIRTDLAKLQVQGLLLVKETLSEEQRAKLRQVVERHMKRKMNARRPDRNEGHRRPERRHDGPRRPGMATAAPEDGPGPDGPGDEPPPEM